MESNSVVGTWDLLSWEHESSDGQPLLPLGEPPKGRIIYGADGQMGVLMGRASRPKTGWSSLFPSGTLEEKAEAYDGVLCYSGSYEITGNQVAHHVAVSTLPGIEGQTVMRTCTVQGNELEISYDSQMGKGSLKWRRLS